MQARRAPLLAVQREIAPQPHEIYIRDIVPHIDMEGMTLPIDASLPTPQRSGSMYGAREHTDIASLLQVGCLALRDLTDEGRHAFSVIAKFHASILLITPDGKLSQRNPAGLPGILWDDLTDRQQLCISQIMIALSFAGASFDPSERMVRTVQFILAHAILPGDANSFVSLTQPNMVIRGHSWVLGNSPGYDYQVVSNDNFWRFIHDEGYRVPPADFDAFLRFILICHGFAYGSYSCQLEPVPESPGTANKYYYISYPVDSYPQFHPSIAHPVYPNTRSAFINTLLALAFVGYLQDADYISEYYVFDWDELKPVLVADDME